MTRLKRCPTCRMYLVWFGGRLICPNAQCTGTEGAR